MCEINVRCGFQRHLSIAKSETSVLIAFFFYNRVAREIVFEPLHPDRAHSCTMSVSLQFSTQFTPRVIPHFIQKKNTDTPMSLCGPAVNSHTRPNKGRRCSARRKKSYLLLSLHRQILVPVRLQHRYRKPRQTHLQVQQQSEVTIGHQETGAIHPKPKTKIKRAIQKFLHPHTFLFTQIRNFLQKWLLGSTLLLLTSQKIEIAKSVRGSKSQGHRAEDALAEPYLEQNSWVT